jgi:hypothetical protein
VRSDEEIRQHAVPDSAGRPIRRERNASVVENLVELLDSRKPNRQFRVDDVIDDEIAREGRGIQPADRPVRPNGIVGHDVQQDVRIDQRQRVIPRRGSAP